MRPQLNGGTLGGRGSKTLHSPTLDDVFKAYANDAVAFAERRGIALDYSEESLDRIDDILASPEIVGRTPREPASPEEEDEMWTLSKMLGAYVGEVAVRAFSGRWIAEDLASGGARPVIEVCGIKGFPMEKVWKRLTESEFDNLGGYCRAVRAIVAQRTSAEVHD